MSRVVETTSTPQLTTSLVNLTGSLFNKSGHGGRDWLDDDGTTDWLFISSFIWVLLTTLLCLVLFCTNRKVRSNKSSLLSLNLLLSVLIYEVIRSVSLIYHDSIGNPSHFTFGLHYCRFSILAWSFSFTLQSFSVVLVTVDACFQAFSSPRYNQYLSSDCVFLVIAASPLILAGLSTILLIFPVSPHIGRIITIEDQDFCFLTIGYSIIKKWLTAYSLVTIVIPGTGSFLLALALLVRMCRHLAAYGSFVNETSMTSRDGASRMKQIVIATFVMNLLFVAFSGPYAWSRLILNYSMLENSKIAFRIYWCCLPLLWLALQPELFAVVTATCWRCWQRGPRETLAMCVDTMRGSEAAGGSDIREYNTDKQSDNFEQVPI